jgi:general secretion pathway protein G
MSLAHRATRLRATSRYHREEGFTLLELLVVLGILGLLAWVVTPPVLRYLESGRVTTTRVQVQSLAQALDFYSHDVGQYPTTEEGLAALVAAPPNAPKWNGPYVKKAESLIDPWGHPFQYRSPGEHGEFDLYSLGSGKPGADGGANQVIANW